MPDLGLSPRRKRLPRSEASNHIPAEAFSSDALLYGALQLLAHATRLTWCTRMNRSTLVTIREIGRGGAGIVEEVWPGRFAEKPVALKRLNVLARKDAEAVARFRREVRILKGFDHPHIVKILHADLNSDDPWFLMPLADGNLADEVQPSTGFSDERIREVFIPVLEAVAYAQQRNVVHRDIKPQNVLMLDGQVVISDFGLGRQFDSASTTLTITGHVGGTHGYTAPEQWIDMSAVDIRSDIYALGSLLYEMATGTNPSAFNPMALTGGYRYLVNRCRSFEPDGRYSSVNQLRDDFDRLSRFDSDITPLADRALRLLETAEVNGEHRQALVSLYVQHPNDETLFQTTVAHWSKQLVTTLARETPNDLNAVVTAFDAHVSGNLNFDFVDVVADFLVTVCDASGELDLRKLVLTRLLVMGAKHSRWHAGGKFAQLARQATSPSEAFLVRDVLMENEYEAKWVEEWIQEEGAVPMILNALSEPSQDGNFGNTLETPSAITTSQGIISPAPFSAEQSVRHPKFGTGRIVEVTLRRDDQELYVDFGVQGRKRLRASFARLEIIE